MKTGAPAEGKAASNEMKTATYKGVLIDMSCGSSGSASAATSPAGGEAMKGSANEQTSSATRSAGESTSSSSSEQSNSANRSAGESTKSSTGDQANAANRSAGDSGGNCPVTATSSQLGMKLDDGKVVRFDLVGNQRAQDEVKNNKKWNKEASENKPIHAKVSGVLDGDKLIVSSIH